MSLFFLTFLIFLPKTCFGFFVVERIWVERDGWVRLLKFFTGFALGLGISSALMLLALRVGIPPLTYASIELGVNLALLVVCAFLFFRLEPLRLKNWRSVFEERLKYQAQERLVFLLLFLAFVISLGTFVYYSFRQPHGFSDAWTLWNNLARYIFRSNDPGLIFDTSRYFRSHYDYPAMSSLNIAWAWSVLQSDSTRVPMAFALLTTFALPAVLWVSVAHLKGNFQGAVVAIVALMTPSLGLTPGQYADALLALHILLTGVFLYYYQINFRPRLLFLAGLMAGLAAWVKNEGLLFVGVSGFVSLWLLFTNHKLKHILQFAAGVITPLLVVFFFKASVFSQNDLAQPMREVLANLTDFSRYTQIGRSYLLGIWQYGDWPVSLALVLLGYASVVRFSPEASKKGISLLLLVLLQQAGYFLIYLVTPHELQWHLYTSLTRLLLQTYALFLFWLFVSLKSPIFSSR